MLFVNQRRRNEPLHELVHALFNLLLLAICPGAPAPVGTFDVQNEPSRREEIVFGD